LQAWLLLAAGVFHTRRRAALAPLVTATPARTCPLSRPCLLARGTDPRGFDWLYTLRAQVLLGWAYTV